MIGFVQLDGRRNFYIGERFNVTNVVEKIQGFEQKLKKIISRKKPSS
jgi:hypothetical protein